MLTKEERQKLDTIYSELSESYNVTVDLCPRLFNILSSTEDIPVIEHKAKAEGNSIAVRELLGIYAKRADSLQPFIDALSAIGLQPLADKLSHDHVRPQTMNLPLANAANMKLKDVVDYVQRHYKRLFAHFRPMPQIERTFHIESIWINLYLENVTQCWSPQHYLACLRDIFREHQLFVVKGNQGQGKTMIQKRFAYDWAVGKMEHFDLVLCARFSDIKESCDTMLELCLKWMLEKNYLKPEHASFLLASIKSMTGEPRKHSWKKALTGKRFKSKKIRLLLIIDGFDQAEVCCHELSRVIRSDTMVGLDYCVLLTSGYLVLQKDKRILCPAATARILAIERKHALSYLYLHFQQSDSSTARQKVAYVCRLMDKNPNLKDLTSVPLHLCFICLIHEKGQIDRHDSLAKIYKRLCHDLALRQTDMFPDLVNQLTKPTHLICDNPALYRLCHLALSDLMSSAKNRFQAKELSLEHLDANDLPLAKMFVKVGYLIPRDDDAFLMHNDPLLEPDTELQFVHSSLEKYFCAALIFHEILKVECMELMKDGPIHWSLSQEHLISENSVLHKLFSSGKAWEAEEMFQFIFQMALDSPSELVQLAVNNSVTLFMAWIGRKSSTYFVFRSTRFVETSLHLLPECVGEQRKALAYYIRDSIALCYSGWELLTMAENVNLDMRKINQWAIFFPQISTIFVCNKSLEQELGWQLAPELDQNLKTVELLLVESQSFALVAEICSQIQCTSITQCKADVDVNSSSELLNVTRNVSITISRLLLNFGCHKHTLELKVEFDKLLSVINGIESLRLEEASFSDMGCTFNDARITETLERLDLESITFRNATEARDFSVTLLKCKKLFRVVFLKWNHSKGELLAIVKTLREHPSLSDFQLRNCCCDTISTLDPFRELWAFLCNWPCLRELWLDGNKLTAEHLDVLVKSIRMPQLKNLNIGGNNDVRQRHIASLGETHPYTFIINSDK